VASSSASPWRARSSCEPGLVLADEPTGNLDPDTGDEVEQLLLELNREAGTTCIVVTHSDRLAAAMDLRFRLAHGHLEAL
jgi:predicted ABC-type transport system involved in lysophospholipase L1 biosynthesis ATPase subunit